MPGLFTSGNIPPGLLAARETASNEFCWGPRELRLYKQVLVNSAAADSGNSPTTELRAGLAMGIITATGQAIQYSPTATDGSQLIAGFLAHPVKMVDVDGTAQAQVAFLVVSAPIKLSKVYGTDRRCRGQWSQRFLLDSDLPSLHYPWRDEIAKTANYTVVAADCGILFTNVGAGGAITFTLPALAQGLCYGFQVVADQSVTVASVAGDDMIVPNDASADSIAFSTVGDKIGGMVKVYVNKAGTKWIVEKLSSNAMTIAT